MKILPKKFNNQQTNTHQVSQCRVLLNPESSFVIIPNKSWDVHCIDNSYPSSNRNITSIPINEGHKQTSINIIKIYSSYNNWLLVVYFPACFNLFFYLISKQIDLHYHPNDWHQ